MDINLLKQICHEEKTSQPRWYFIHRNVSVYITRALIPCNIKPNHISILMILVGVAGSLMIGSSLMLINLAGILVLYLSFLLDKVDGEIARYKKVFSVNGIVIDWLYHRIFIFGTYIGICFKIFNTENSNMFLYGVLTSFFAVLIEDNQFVSYIIYAQKLYRKRYLFKNKTPEANKYIRILFRYTKIMKVFRTNITILYMLLPLYIIGNYYPGILKFFIYLSIAINALYFAIQSIWYFSYKRVEELNLIDNDVTVYLEESYEQDSVCGK